MAIGFLLIFNFFIVLLGVVDLVNSTPQFINPFKIRIPPPKLKFIAGRLLFPPFPQVPEETTTTTTTLKPPYPDLIIDRFVQDYIARHSPEKNTELIQRGGEPDPVNNQRPDRIAFSEKMSQPANNSFPHLNNKQSPNNLMDEKRMESAENKEIVLVVGGALGKLSPLEQRVIKDLLGKKLVEELERVKDEENYRPDKNPVDGRTAQKLEELQNPAKYQQPVNYNPPTVDTSFYRQTHAAGNEDANYNKSGAVTDKNSTSHVDNSRLSSQQELHQNPASYQHVIDNHGPLTANPTGQKPTNTTVHSMNPEDSTGPVSSYKSKDDSVHSMGILSTGKNATDSRG